MELVTGGQGKAHIKSVDAGAFNAGIFGNGGIVLNTLTTFHAEIINNNTVRIHAGDLSNQGRHMRIRHGEYEDLNISSGTEGQSRYDLIVARYEMASDGTESAKLSVIKGTSTAGTPVDPDYTQGDTLTGALVDEFPLYRVKISGTVIEELEKLFDIAKDMSGLISNDDVYKFESKTLENVDGNSDFTISITMDVPDGASADDAIILDAYLEVEELGWPTHRPINRYRIDYEKIRLYTAKGGRVISIQGNLNAGNTMNCKMVAYVLFISDFGNGSEGGGNSSSGTTTGGGSTDSGNEVSASNNYAIPQQYGAVGDGENDDTEAIQSAVNDNVVTFIPEGNYKITASIIIPSQHMIVGTGMKSKIFTFDELDFIIKTDDNSYETSIEKLYLEGNATAGGILINSSSDPGRDLSHKISNVSIKNTAKYGIRIDSYARNCKINNIDMHYVKQVNAENGVGIMCDGTDNFFSQVSVDSTDSYGIYLWNNNHLTNTKVFCCSKKDYLASMYIKGIGNVVTTFCSQENYGPALKIDGNSNYVSGAFDSNGCEHLTDDISAIIMNGNYNKVEGVVTDGRLNGKVDHCIYLKESAVFNDINLQLNRVSGSQYPDMDIISSTLTDSANDIKINCQKIHSFSDAKVVNIFANIRSTQDDTSGNMTITRQDGIVTYSVPDASSISKYTGARITITFNDLLKSAISEGKKYLIVMFEGCAHGEAMYFECTLRDSWNGSQLGEKIFSQMSASKGFTTKITMINIDGLTLNEEHDNDIWLACIRNDKSYESGYECTYYAKNLRAAFL